MIAPSLACLLAITWLVTEKTLDPFDYADAAAAQAVWTTPVECPPVTVVRSGERNVLRLPAPFAAQSDLPRVYADRLVDLDLSSPSRFALELECDQPESMLSITLYFRSPGGWFSAEQGLRERGRQTLVFRKDNFHTEGSPTGWNRIDAIRISAWQGQSRDCDIRLVRLASLWHEIAIVVSSGAAAEAAQAHRAARNLAGVFDELGLGVDTIDQSAVARGALGDRALAVLPRDLKLLDGEIDAIIRFVEQGGKVLAACSMPDRLAAALGFEPTPPDDAAAGRVEQSSDRGVLVADLPSPDTTRDAEQAKAALADVVERLDPMLARNMARHAMERVGAVGHCDDVEAVAEQVGEHGSADASRRLAEGSRLLAAAERLFERGDHGEARRKATEARRQFVEAYLRAQPARPSEARAFWEHAGTGAYPGDWARTARELRKAGFNMVLPNMLWGGAAHFPSEVLPPSVIHRRHGDQIDQCVKAARQHDLEVHVWKVNWYLGHLAPKDFVAKLDSERRTQVSVHGTRTNWLCPSHPDNFKLELDSMLEVVRKYPVDGLHFDYIRYPSREYCYCDGCRERFEASSGRPVENWPTECYSGGRKDEYNAWRCDQITRLVEAVSREARKIRPGVKISAAVFGAYPACKQSIAQDWVAWAKAGYVDFLCPMDYTNSDQAFRGLVSNQLRLLDGCVPIYPGIGATASNSALPAHRVVGQIRHASDLGAGGFTIFNLSATTAEGLLPGVGTSLEPKDAVPPHRSTH